ncbi:hypothetical protein GGQ57_003457 [Parabacteroides faecis]|uniref:Uncharacterized protein n=1 Tax=Parabacteroides faecis TaxID=1217282 RepID=A0ABR6KPX6_9BACT|nr:hypothetical protein [Parabacteroides faecis]
MIRIKTDEVQFKSNTTGYEHCARPLMGILLSGTFGQFTRFIPSADDGLFSRFLAYTVDKPVEWKDLTDEDNSPSSNNYYHDLGLRVLDMGNFLDKYPTFVCYTKKQRDRMNARFRYLSENTYVSLAFIRVGTALSVLYPENLFHLRTETVSPSLHLFDNRKQGFTCFRYGIFGMRRQFLKYLFLYHPVHFQFFQLLVYDPRAGIFKQAVKLTRTLRPCTQFLDDATLPLPSDHFHSDLYATVNVKRYFLLIHTCYFGIKIQIKTGHLQKKLVYPLSVSIVINLSVL